MSSVVEEIRAEGRAELQTAIILQMLRMGRFTFEDIAESVPNMLILHVFTCTR